MERRIAVPLHYPVDYVLIVIIKGGWPVRGLYHSVTSFLKSKGYETTAVICYREQCLRKCRLIIIVTPDVKPILDLKIKIFSRVHKQIAKSLTVELVHHYLAFVAVLRRQP